MRRLQALVALLLLALSASSLAQPVAAVTLAPGGGTPGTAENLELVGHEPLFNRGMNAAPAIYTSRNPTLLRHRAFVTWHSGGLQAIDICAHGRMRQAGWFSPTPLLAVATEDPALSRGPNKVVMCSSPIVRNGLIYALDIRNRRYVLRYTGPDRGEVRRIHFLEGNSNLGDALELAGVRRRWGRSGPPQLAVALAGSRGMLRCSQASSRYAQSRRSVSLWPMAIAMSRKMRSTRWSDRCCSCAAVIEDLEVRRLRVVDLEVVSERRPQSTVASGAPEAAS